MSQMLYKGQTVNSVGSEADLVKYTNTDSGLASTNVQSAIDELASNKGAGIVSVTYAEYIAKKEEYDASDNIIKITDKGGLMNYTDNDISSDAIDGATTVHEALVSLDEELNIGYDYEIATTYVYSGSCIEIRTLSDGTSLPTDEESLSKYLNKTFYLPTGASGAISSKGTIYSKAGYYTPIKLGAYSTRYSLYLCYSTVEGNDPDNGLDYCTYSTTGSSIKSLLDSKADLVSGKVPSTQLPSYVDDVLEYDSKSSFPTTGEAGKIYVATDTNLTYRWTGSTYVEISQSLALGETSATAYAGDKGAATTTLLGTASEASSISGDTAFAKINTLNNNLADKQNKAWTYLTTLYAGGSVNISGYNDIFFKYALNNANTSFCQVINTRIVSTCKSSGVDGNSMQFNFTISDNTLTIDKVYFNASEVDYGIQIYVR